jgi:hypothetical protein
MLDGHMPRTGEYTSYRQSFGCALPRECVPIGGISRKQYCVSRGPLSSCGDHGLHSLVNGSALVRGGAWGGESPIYY